jgi:hypothetical protein
MQAKDNLVWSAEATRHAVTTRNEIRVGLNKCRGIIQMSESECVVRIRDGIDAYQAAASTAPFQG